MPKTARIELRVTPEMRAAINEARGDVSLNRWCERALERALGVDDRAPAPAVPTPPRTPAKPAAPAFNRVTTLKR